jgi:hypothetical protein
MQPILVVLRDIHQVLSSPDWSGISGIVGILSLSAALIALFRKPQPSSRQVARLPHLKKFLLAGFGCADFKKINWPS